MSSGGSLRYAWLILCFVAIAASALVWACTRPKGTSCCVGRVVKKKEEGKWRGGRKADKIDLTDTEDDDDDNDFRDATAKPISSISNPLLPQDLRETRLKDRERAVKKPPLHRGYAYAFAIIAGTSGALQQVWGLGVQRGGRGVSL